MIAFRRRESRPVGGTTMAAQAFPALQPTLPEGPEQACRNADDWWLDCAERALGWWAETGRPFTADDLRALGVPDPDHPNRIGGLFRRAYRTGLIEPVGYMPSTRPSRNGGVLRTWRGVRKDKTA